MEKLTDQQIQNFIDVGYLKVERAFPREVANECRSILWEAIQLSPHQPETWTLPVIRIGEFAHEPFQKAANTNILHQCFDQLTGNNWLPRMTLGTFPIRFPSKEPSNDTGWHVDASFPGKDPNNYLEWRININSKGRALLMLFLFSDVGEQDAPTIILERSHTDVAKLLAPAGEEGLSFMELANRLDELPSRKKVFATGAAGTVYLCHPFLVHAAQNHHGVTPKFMAQPPLLPKQPFNIHQPEERLCPIEKAILNALIE